MSASLFANVNGTLVDATSPYLDGKNRAFRYGDGLFESIRVINGRPLFLEHHLARLREGMQVLRMDLPEDYSTDFFEKQLLQLLEANRFNEGARLRLTVFRQEGGYYHPKTNSPGFCIEAEALEHNRYHLNEDGLAVDLYTEIKKPVNKLSIYKTCNGLQYIVGALWAREQKLDDALIVNDKGHIIEATGANLFIVCNGVLYTPSLTDGCLAGVMRMQIINLALEHKIKVYECSLSPQNLLVADEIFLTNAIRGLQWVSSYRMKRYYNSVTRGLLDKLNQLAEAK